MYVYVYVHVYISLRNNLFRMFLKVSNVSDINFFLGGMGDFERKQQR